MISLEKGDRVRVLSKSIGRDICHLDYEEGKVVAVGKTFVRVMGDSQDEGWDQYLKKDLERIAPESEEINNLFDETISDL